MTDTPTRTSKFRFFIGFIALSGGLGGLAGLYFVTLPTTNERPLLVALGVVLGWGSAVVQSEFGVVPPARKIPPKKPPEERS